MKENFYTEQSNEAELREIKEKYRLTSLSFSAVVQSLIARELRVTIERNVNQLEVVFENGQTFVVDVYEKTTNFQQ